MLWLSLIVDWCVMSCTKRASLYTLGCRLNQAESNLFAEKLQEAGYEIVSFGEAADLGIIHTCTVTREADTKSRKMIRQFIRTNPQAFTVVLGCYAQVGSAALAEIEGVDLIVGNQDKMDFLDYVRQEKNASPMIIRNSIKRAPFTLNFARTLPVTCRRENLKIQDGCNCMCSYCIIPFARGRVRSRALNDLLEEARLRVDAGAQEIVLTGVNIGTYAYEGGALPEVVDALNEIPGLRRIRISSLEPKTIPESLFEMMCDPEHALVPYLHIPLQSGSNRILQAMRRTYTREEYIEFVEKAAACVPDIGIGTDIMVGFPGETEEDFAQSYNLLAETPLFYAHVFKYSDRNGTLASRMSGKIPPPMANERSLRLRRLSEKKTNEFAASFVGKTQEVLFEQEISGRWVGYSENYLRVSVESSFSLKNQIFQVYLQRQNDGELWGSVENSEGAVCV